MFLLNRAVYLQSSFFVTTHCLWAEQPWSYLEQIKVVPATYKNNLPQEGILRESLPIPYSIPLSVIALAFRTHFADLTP